jgi:hypothetical protein
MLPGVQTNMVGSVLQIVVANAPKETMLIPKLIAEYFQEIFDVLQCIMFTSSFSFQKNLSIKKNTLYILKSTIFWDITPHSPLNSTDV